MIPGLLEKSLFDDKRGQIVFVDHWIDDERHQNQIY
jgi:hypothetical protein